MKRFKRPLLYVVLLVIVLGAVLTIASVVTRTSPTIVTTADDLWPVGNSKTVVKMLSETRTALAKPELRSTGTAPAQATATMP